MAQTNGRKYIYVIKEGGSWIWRERRRSPIVGMFPFNLDQGEEASLTGSCLPIKVGAYGVATM